MTIFGEMALTYWPLVIDLAAVIPPYDAYAINTATEKVTPLSGLSNPLPALNDVPANQLNIIDSPNHQWILFDKTICWGKADNEGLPENGAHILSAVKADGSCTISHKINRGEYPVDKASWLDSHRYMWCLWSDGQLIIHVYDVNNAELSQTILVYDSQAIMKRISDPYLMTSDWHLFFIMGNFSDGKQSGVTLGDINLRSQPACIQQEAIVLPKRATLDKNDFVLSPDGKRIAWIFHFQDRYAHHPNLWEQFWVVHIQHRARLLPKNIPTEEVWVSSRNGSDMHQIGYKIETWRLDTNIDNMKWLPDGKAVSFMYSGRGMNGKDGLYTIPAD